MEVVVDAYDSGERAMGWYYYLVSQIKPLDANGETIEAIEDWHYWVQQGYEF